MYEQEKQRSTHLLILIVCTVLILALTGEAILLGWEIGAVVLLLLGLTVCWVFHIIEKMPESSRLWQYFILSMLAFFFYGIHETSVYDLAPLMIVIIILYSATENYSIIRLCVITYFLTMGYDFVFVLGRDIELSSLVITRSIFHLVLVFMAGMITKTILERRNKERKNSENQIAELEETNRRTEDFLTNVSHELRTPINAVTGITAVMLKNEDNDDRKKNLQSIQVAGYRLFGQIGDILDYTEIDTKRITVSEEAYMISSLINDVINRNHQSDKGKKLELVFDIDPDVPSVLLGDGKKIKKILGHLIDNAFKFTQKGGVYVRVYAIKKKYGVNLCIRVSDTGVGIAQEELEKIKERFYQSNAGRNRRAGGLGLGLSIVSGMVSVMEGFIQIESVVGEGTTVTVSIPQKIVDEAKVMVVDDKADLCLACYLRPEKYEVPQVRDYYNEMISHMVQGLEISLHRISNMDELEKLASMYQLTHLFIGKEEYGENEKYFEDLNQNVKVIVVADEDFSLPKESRIKILKKPFYSLPIVNILNADSLENESVLKEKTMLCPGVKVLVVDDEPMNLMVAEGIFKDYQMIVTKADSGKRAIELCEKEDFDLIFLDHMMPEMDGVETLKRIRKIDNNSNRVLTIIAFTANAVSGAREMFLREGFDEFVSKPIEPLELERVLRKVLPKSSVVFVDENSKKNSNKEIKVEKDAQEANNNSEKDRMTELEEAGINTKSGIQYCGGDDKFYFELLTQFAEDFKQKVSDVGTFFAQKDFENYCIRVHAVKSTAKMVGADSLSENAKNMEMAAKNQDVDYIKKHHEELVNEYTQVVQSICDVLELNTKSRINETEVDKTEVDETEISTDDLIERLRALVEGLKTFEADKAESLLSELSTVVYRGEKVENLLCDVRLDVDDFEFGAASEKVKSLIKNLEGGEAE